MLHVRILRFLQPGRLHPLSTRLQRTVKMAPKRKTDTPALAPKEEGVSRKASKLIAAPVASAAQEEVHAEAQPATSYAHYDAYLMKSEPDEFSIDALEAKPNSTGHWDGVRNAQARNIMRGMHVGDRVLFYHSSCKVPAVMGLAEVARTAYPDFTAWDPKSKYYDTSSPEDKPKWWMVDVKLIRKLARPVSLEEIRAAAAAQPDGPLASMVLIQRSRLSVQPVTDAQWHAILELEKQDALVPAPKVKGGAKGKAVGQKREAGDAAEPAVTESEAAAADVVKQPAGGKKQAKAKEVKEPSAAKPPAAAKEPVVAKPAATSKESHAATKGSGAAKQGLDGTEAKESKGRGNKGSAGVVAAEEPKPMVKGKGRGSRAKKAAGTQ